jgi:diguanylate cyclase (GGDEF)-like protein
MSIAAFAFAAAAAAFVVALSVAIVRSRKASDRRLARAMLEMGERMDVLARELAHTLEKVREDALRARIVESLGQALDLDEVMARCAEAAASLPSVAGAVVRVEVDGATLVAAAGLDPELAGAVSGPPDGSRIRAVGISYHYPAGDAAPTAMRSAIAVPLEVDGRQLGFLTVFGQGDELTEAEFDSLEAIARHAAPAIANARRLTEVSRLPETDGLTGLGNRHLFHETLALEVARAHRHGRRLAVCVLDLDDFRATNDRVGQVEGDSLLVEVAELLRESIRPGSLACRTGGDEFAVILPESSRIAAEGLFAQLQATLRRRPPSPTPILSLSAGIAEVQPEDDGVSLFERAEQALQRAKKAGKGTAA